MTFSIPRQPLAVRTTAHAIAVEPAPSTGTVPHAAGQEPPAAPDPAISGASQRYVPPFMREKIGAFQSSRLAQTGAEQHVQLRGKFDASIKLRGTEEIFRSRFARAYALYQKADASLPDPLLQLFENSNARLFIGTDVIPGEVAFTRVFIGAARTMEMRTDDLQAFAQAILRGERLEVVVMINGVRNMDHTGNMERVAHTLNHELSLHAAEYLRFYNIVSDLKTEQEIIEFCQRSEWDGGLLSAETQHSGLAALGDPARFYDGNRRLLATHRAMLGQLSGNEVKWRLQHDYEYDVREHLKDF